MNASLVVVAGIPRSGTTWTGQALAHAHGSPLVHEPDNEKEFLAAFAAKRGLGRFPVLSPGDRAAAYESLWLRALSGWGEPDTRRTRIAARLWSRSSGERREAALRGRMSVGLRAALALAGSPVPPASGAEAGKAVVKTVHAPLALEWIADRFPGLRVVVVLRHPAGVLSSWRELKLPDQDRGLDRHPAVRDGLMASWDISPPDTGALARAAWHVCLLTAALFDAAGRHPEWHVVEHEDLCRRPLERFAALARELGIGWTSHAEQYLLASDAVGQGFAVRRRAGEQPGRWRSRLTGEEVEVLGRTMRRFPLLERWTDDLASPLASGPAQG